MRKSSKYILSAAAVILMIVAGAILPGEMAAGRDRLILGQVYSEPLDAAELSDYVNISMVDKVSLLGQAAGVSLLPLKTGAVYDPDSIRARFTGELEKLFMLGICPLDEEAGPGGVSAAATLYILNDAPAISAIVWKVDTRADTVRGEYYMDDQTGKILSFSLSGSGFGEWVYEEGTVSAWAAYLGADVRNIRRIGQGETGAEAGYPAQDSEDALVGTTGTNGTTNTTGPVGPEAADDAGGPGGLDGGSGTGSPDSIGGASGAGSPDSPVVGETAFRFELYAGSRSVGALLRCFTQSGAASANSWGLTYLQTSSDRIFANE